MVKPLAILALTGIALALAACAAPPSAPLDWNRPFEPMTSAPVFTHDMAIANPPHPRPFYVDYMEEPTRFEFHPRNLTPEEPDDTASTEQPAADYGAADTGGAE